MGQSLFKSPKSLSGSQASMVSSNLSNTLSQQQNLINMMAQYLPGGSKHAGQSKILMDQYKQNVLSDLAQNLGGNRSSSMLNNAIGQSAQQLGQQLSQNDMANMQNLLANLLALSNQDASLLSQRAAERSQPNAIGSLLKTLINPAPMLGSSLIGKAASGLKKLF